MPGFVRVLNEQVFVSFGRKFGAGHCKEMYCVGYSVKYQLSSQSRCRGSASVQGDVVGASCLLGKTRETHTYEMRSSSPVNTIGRKHAAPASTNAKMIEN
jgi:hypothetical protein